MIVFTLLLLGDTEMNPGPNSLSARRPPRFSKETFALYSLNIRYLLNIKNTTALTDLFAWQETKISTSTDAHISFPTYLLPLTPIFLIPPIYSLLSFPRITPSSKSAEISGGSSAFLVWEPAILLATLSNLLNALPYITHRLASDMLTVFSIYMLFSCACHPPLRSI